METKKVNEDNIMDIDSSSVASDASHANSSTSYPNLCVYSVSDLEVYESGGYSHKAIQKLPINLFSSKHSNLDDFRALNLGKKSWATQWLLLYIILYIKYLIYYYIIHYIIY